MARTKPERRRRRPPAAEGPSSPWRPPLFALAVSALLLTIRVAFDGASTAPYAAAGRRALLDGGEPSLRARKDRTPRGGRPAGDVQRRSMAGDFVRRSMAVAAAEGAGVVDEYGNPTRRMQEELETWPAYEGKHRFEECVDKSISQCQTLVDTFVGAHPEQFNNQTTLWLDVRKIREVTDQSYYKVVLRTDMDGQNVNGAFNDGKVHYPWPWTVFGEDLSIGPWECAGMGTADCCRMIQEDVQDPNDAGDFLACYVEEPVGTTNNPERIDRAITVVNANGRVLRPPIAH